MEELNSAVKVPTQVLSPYPGSPLSVKTEFYGVPVKNTDTALTIVFSDGTTQLIN